METATPTATKEVYGSFLQNRLVSVKPVESNGKWSTLLVQGQENKKDPFMYNKVKRSFQVPLNSEARGGGIKVILDDQKRVKIQKYIESHPNGMTQKEFFERELGGVDLNTTLANDKNFWRTDIRGRVTLTKEGLRLNLNNSVDMLKYLILMSNKSAISPSYDERVLKATYEFMMVDEAKVIVKQIEEAEVEAKAWVKYAEITGSSKSTISFIKSLGRVIPATAIEDKDWLKGEVLKVLKADPVKFLEIVNHPQYNERIFVQEAIDAGAIIRKSDKRYTLDNGIELGDLTETVNYLLDAENQETKLRINARIELTKRK